MRLSSWLTILSISVMFFILIGCNKRGTPVDIRDAADQFGVELLFVKDNCRVYRFGDGGYARYFTDCTETISQHSCGKNCILHENIKSK